MYLVITISKYIQKMYSISAISTFSTFSTFNQCNQYAQSVSVANMNTFFVPVIGTVQLVKIDIFTVSV